MTDGTTGEELDRGFLISAKDLAAHEHLAEIAEAGVGCLKVEGRKKKPEYVATVTRGYRVSHRLGEHIRRRGRGRSCRSSAAASRAGCTAAARVASTSRATSPTTAAVLGGW